MDYGDTFNEGAFDAQTARYEIANLQLQLIESLKIQKLKDKSLENQCEEVLFNRRSSF